MAESKVLQYFLLISLMIFSTQALRVYLTNGIAGRNSYEYEGEIDVYMSGGSRCYGGCAELNTFVAKPGTTKVVVYIRSGDQVNRDGFGHESDRKTLSNVLLNRHRYELLYLVVDDFFDGDERLIGEFLERSIKSFQTNFHVNVIGEGFMNKSYMRPSGELDAYREDHNVFKGKLYEKIRDLYRRHD